MKNKEKFDLSKFKKLSDKDKEQYLMNVIIKNMENSNFNKEDNIK